MAHRSTREPRVGIRRGVFGPVQTSGAPVRRAAQAAAAAGAGAGVVGDPLAGIEAPGALRRILRFGRIGVSSAATRSPTDILLLLVQDLRDQGIPEEAIAKIEDLGESFLRKGAVPQSVASLAGGSGNVAEIKASLGMARQATRGVTAGALEREFNDMISTMRKVSGSDPNALRAIEEIRKLGPKAVANVGAQATVSAFSRRGADPFSSQLLKRAQGKAPSPILAKGIEDVVKQVGGGKLPPVTGAAGTALTKAGATGVSTLARGARAVGRGIIGSSPLGALALGGLTVASIAPRFLERLGRKERGQKAAIRGFGALGPSSSTEFLRDVVQQQESVSRRRITMQQFEPELFQRVLQVLSDQGQAPGGLTSTERRIGTPVGEAFRGRRSAKDVQFLLDQLMSQMGG